MNTTTCKVGGCDNPCVWKLTAKSGYVVGVLCEAHKRSWYDTQPNHVTTLTRIGEKGEEHEMDTQPQKGRENVSSHAPQYVDTSPGMERGDDFAGGVERGRAVGQLVPYAKPETDSAEGERREVDLLRPTTLAQTQEVRQYGDLKLSSIQQDILGQEIAYDRVEIRPDGQVYAQWSEYAERLDAAFGVGNWAQVPFDRPQLQDNFVCWGFDLYVRGQWVSQAIGEHPDPGNRRMSLANRAEAAKSDALVKNCKALGIFRELWDVNFRLEWLEEMAVRVWALQTEYSTKGAWLWRRKDRNPFYKEKPAKENDLEQGANRRDYADDARDHLESIQNEDSGTTTTVGGNRRP